MTTSIDLLYPDIPLPGVKTNRQLLKRLRQVAGELFKRHQHSRTIQFQLEDKENWTQTCLSMIRYPQFYPTEAVIGLRVEDDQASPAHVLCHLFAQELLRHCHDGTVTMRTEVLFNCGHKFKTKIEEIRVCSGELIINDLPVPA